LSQLRIEIALARKANQFAEKTKIVGDEDQEELRMSLRSFGLRLQLFSVKLRAGVFLQHPEPASESCNQGESMVK
jgi:hypothetical protein